MNPAVKDRLNQNAFFQAIEAKNFSAYTRKVIDYLFLTLGFRYSITARQIALVLSTPVKDAEALVKQLVEAGVLLQCPKIDYERSYKLNSELAYVSPEQQRALFKVIPGGRKD